MTKSLRQLQWLKKTQRMIENQKLPNYQLRFKSNLNPKLSAGRYQDDFYVILLICKKYYEEFSVIFLHIF